MRLSLVIGVYVENTKFHEHFCVNLSLHFNAELSENDGNH